MQHRTKLAAIVVSTIFAVSAYADPITIDTYADLENIPDPLGGYAMVDHTVTGNDGDWVNSFTLSSGNVVNLDTNVQIMTPGWVQDPVGETIYGVPGNIITLTPTNPLSAISFMIYSEFGGRGWVSATWEDSQGNIGSVRNPDSGSFPINQRAPGVGVGIYAEPGACITSITIEPPRWGFGAISTAEAEPCVQVAEPSSLGLMGIGLLALGILATRRRVVIA